MLIGKLATESGVSRDTIRYYEKRGLIHAGRQNGVTNAYKNYSAETLRRLFRIRQLKSLGFTLTEILALLDYLEKNQDACATLPAELDQKVALLDEKIVLLTNYRNQLQRVRQACDGHCATPDDLPECFGPARF